MTLPTDVNSTPNYTAAQHATHHNDIHTHVNSHSGTSVLVAAARRTSSDLSLNNSAWTNVDTGLDLTIAAATGDYIEVTVSGLWGNTNFAYLDVVTVVSGSPVNSFADAASPRSTGSGVKAWSKENSGYGEIGGSVIYAVQAGDISGGNVLLRLRYKSTGAITLFADLDNVLQWHAKNLGH